MAMIVLVLLFESGIFSIIFAMCVRGLGARTKFGSVVLTAATSGGAVVPAFMSPVTDQHDLRYSFCVVVAVFAFGALLPVYACIAPAAREQVDPVHERRGTRRKGGEAPTSRRASRVLGAMRRRKKNAADLPGTDHVESNEDKEAA